jgi:hypothetical protein
MQRSATPGNAMSQTGNTAQNASRGAQQVPAMTENSNVQVHGTVRRFVRNEIERDYGFDFADWGMTDTNWFNTYEGRPVLVADRIDVRR